MSRTHRNPIRLYPGNKTYRAFLRKPKTFNEMRQNTALLHDANSDEFEYRLSGRNRILRRKRLPTLWDDMPISGNIEDYQNKHF